MTPQVPRSLLGEVDALAISDLRTFGVGSGGPMQRGAQPTPTGRCQYSAGPRGRRLRSPV
jgi:hypothetical protein